MSEYKEIKGKTVQFIATDPSDTGAEGQVWYNSTAGAFKSALVSAAWVSSSPTSNPSTGQMSVGHTQTATIKAGGYNPPITSAESYNGSGWSSEPSLNTARGLGGPFGTGNTSAAVTAGYTAPGGSNINNTEEFDGSSWTTTGTLPYSARGVAAFGTQTAGVAVGGFTTVDVNTTSEYNGSTWTAATAMPGTRNYATTFGQSQTAGGVAGGYLASPPYNTAILYDGTSWTDTGSLPSGKKSASGFGIQTSALLVGGTTDPGPNSQESILFNGTTWSVDANTGVDVIGHSYGSGNTTNGLIANTGTGVIEYNKSINAITAAAWSSGGALPAIQYTHNGTGTQTAGLSFGGLKNSPPVTTGDTNEYDGSAWTAGGSMNQGRQNVGSAKQGSQTAALAMGGVNPPTSTIYSNTESYDGSTWTSLNTTNTAKHHSSGGQGTQTSALWAAGSTSIGPAGPGTTGNTEEWDGTSWTAGGSLSQARQNSASLGTQTDALEFGGYVPSPGTLNSSEIYNGTSWTAGATGPSQGYNLAGAGPTSSGIISGGYPSTTTTSGYDGSNFYTLPSMATARSTHAGVGSAGTNGLAIGGYNSSTSTYFNTTEEWTGETSTLNVKTLTTS